MLTRIADSQADRSSSQVLASTMSSTQSHTQPGSLDNDYMPPSSSQESSAGTNPFATQDVAIARNHQPPPAPRKQRQPWRLPTAAFLPSKHTSSRDASLVTSADHCMPDRRPHNGPPITHHSSEEDRNPNHLPGRSQKDHSNPARAVSRGRNNYTYPLRTRLFPQRAPVSPFGRPGSRQHISDSATKAMTRSTNNVVPSYKFIDVNGHKNEPTETIDKHKDRQPVQARDKNSSVAAKITDTQVADMTSQSSKDKGVDKVIVPTDDARIEVASRNKPHDEKYLNSRATHIIPKVAKAKFEGRLQDEKSHKRKRISKSQSLNHTLASSSSKNKLQKPSAKKVKLQPKSRKQTNERVKPTELAKPAMSRNLDARDRASKLPTRQQNPSVMASEAKPPRDQNLTVEKSTPLQKRNAKSNPVTDASDDTDTTDSNSSDSDGSSGEKLSSNKNSLGATGNNVKTCVEKNVVHGGKLVTPKSEAMDGESHDSSVLTGGTASRRKSLRSKKDRMQYLEIMLKNQHYEIMQLRAIISHYGLKGIQVDEALIRMRDKQTVEEAILSIQRYVFNDQDTLTEDTGKKE